LFLAGCSKSPSSPTSTGSLSVTLTWDSVVDLDLHVVEPSGAEVYWYTTPSASGGTLSGDAHELCQQNTASETISWPSTAPPGTYTVRVDIYDACGSPQVITNYTVTVMNGSTSTPYKGQITGDGDLGAAGAGQFVTSFKR